MTEGTALATIFTGDPPERVLLKHTPLIRVLCQVRFDPVLAIRSEDRITAFQDVIRNMYPRLRREQGPVITFGVGLPVSTTDTFIWRFDDPAADYRLSLSTDFLTIETTRYTSREDFIERIAHALRSLAATDVAPSNVNRVGVRYVDRVSGEAEVRDVSQLVRPEVRGMLALLTEGAADLKQTVQESIIQHDDSTIRSLVAFLPANATIDPGIAASVDEPSWLFDVDAFQEGDREFVVDEALQTAGDLADKCHRVFHWAVTDDFLRHFGGDV